MDQNAQKPLSRLARQQAVREVRKNKQAPWWTALLIAVMMALAAVPLITSQNSDYAVPQAKKEHAKPKPAVEKTSKAKPAPKVISLLPSGVMTSRQPPIIDMLFSYLRIAPSS